MDFNNNIMFSVYVIVFECIIIIFFGAFVRLNTVTLTNIDSFTGSLALLLGFAMISLSRKLLSWSSIGNLLVLLAVNFQWNILWYQLWTSCFTGFNVTFGISTMLLMNCLSCSLCCLLSFSDFIGRISWRQLLIISLVQSIGFSLNSAIITYGIKAFDGGGGIHIFFLAGIYSLAMWFIAFRAQEAFSAQSKPKYTYPGITFSIIGVVLIIFGWPSFNQGGALSSAVIADTSATSILSQCAFVNTLFTLSAAIITAFLYHSPQNKLKLHLFVDAIVNVINRLIQAGIIMASSTDVLLNPAAGLVLGAVASASTMTLFKYYENTFILECLPNSAFKAGFGFLSGIFASIIVASRNNATPSLTSSILTSAAYDLAALALTIGLGLLFGVGCGYLLKLLPGPNKEDIGLDKIMWDVQYESQPLYLSDQIPADVLNSNRLHNSLVPNSDKDPRISRKESNKQIRGSDYVPPPTGVSPKNPMNNSINKKPIAPRRINSTNDLNKPGSPMIFEQNIIDETEERDPPNIIKRLNYDQNEIIKEGGVYAPNI